MTWGGASGHLSYENEVPESSTGPWLWYNSYMKVKIVEVQNIWNLNGVPEKEYFWAKGPNSKVQFAKFQFKNHSVFCKIKLEDSGHDKKSQKLQ